MTRVYLIRVGIDSESGGFVAPYFKEDKNILYIPLFNWDNGKNKVLKSYSQIKTNYPTINLMDYFPKDEISDKKWDYDLSEVKAHYDPEFDSMTYGDFKGGNILGSFREDDFILFYGSFFPTNKNFKYNNYTISQLKKIQSGNKRFYIFAYLRLKYPPITNNNFKKYFDEIKNNVHVIKGDLKKDKDLFILKGKKDSGYIKPIRIDNGLIKGSNYQANNFLLKYKLNSDNSGINRLYCELKSSIIKKILKNKKIK